MPRTLSYGVMRAGRWLDRAELDRRLLISPKTWFALALNATPSNTGYGITRQHGYGGASKPDKAIG